MMQAEISLPRLVISSYKGKSGKTLATLSLISAFSRKGLKVAAFKAGPDFIDPSYYRALLPSSSSSAGRNLDYVLMGREGVLRRLYKYSYGKDIALIEGNHGLYDSVDGITENGSTAQLAKTLSAPVILVVDCERVNRSVRALIRGLVSFDREVKIAGVILTNIVSKQLEKLTRSIEEEGLPVVGFIPRSEEIADALKYRHLGLSHMSEKQHDESSKLSSLIHEKASRNINLPEVKRLALEGSETIRFSAGDETPHERGKIKIGILSGKSFTFYYPETIERASLLGSLAIIDPEREQALPELDVLLIGGGFPEVYAEKLEKNKPLMTDIARFSERRGKVYAECGGLMYLTRNIVYSNEVYNMVGLIDATAVVTKEPAAHGYVTASVLKDIPIARAGTILRGHTFHYSKILLRGLYDLALSCGEKLGITKGLDGVLVNENTYAHYIHLHPDTYDFLGRLVDGLGDFLPSRPAAEPILNQATGRP